MALSDLIGQQAADPYAAALEGILKGIQGGNYYGGSSALGGSSSLGGMTTGGGSPGTSTTYGTSLSRVTPAEEQAAYKTAFEGLLTPDFGMVPEAQLSGYFNLANPYLFGQGMERINQQLAEAGFAPSGVGGIGPQAELAARLQAQLGVQQAQALIANATAGAGARSQAGLDIGQSRYKALTTPNVSSKQVQVGPGVGSATVQQSPMGADPSAWLAGGSGGSGGSGGGGGGSKSGTGGGGGGTGGGGGGDGKSSTPSGSYFATGIGANQPDEPGYESWRKYLPGGSGYGNMLNTAPREPYGGYAEEQAADAWAGPGGYSGYQDMVNGIPMFGTRAQAMAYEAATGRPAQGRVV